MGVYYIHDVYLYLNNGLYFAGLSPSSTNHGLPPLIPFLCSLVFKTDYVSDSVILIISGLFYIITGLSFYGLLRLRFKELLSFTGTILLLCFPINLAWASKGMLDIPGLGMSILAIYLMALGLYRNPKYYYIAFPVLILGFFTRYTVILTLPAMLMLILFTGNPLNYINRHLGKLIKGILSGLITLIAILGIYKINNIPFFFISQSSSISATSNPGAHTQAVATSTATATTNNLWYYINNLPLYIGTEKWIPYSFKPGAYNFNKMVWMGNSPSIISIILISIILIGILLYISQILNKHNRARISKNKNKFYYLKIILFIIPLIVYFVSFTKVSLYTSIALISISILALFRLIRKADLKYMAIDFMFIYWGIVNFSFYTYHIIKTDRYAITFTPVFAYMIILGLYLIYKKLEDFKIFKEKLNIIKTLIPILLIIGSLGFTGYCFAVNTPHTFDNQSPQNILTASQDQKEVCNWLIENDSNYLNKTIWGDDWSGISFELRMNVNKTDNLKNESNFTETLKANNVSYYFAEGRNSNIKDGYYIIKEKNNCTLYKKA
ncbi:hypothetical protein BGI41_03665 [Methanobrevibacter sp. 87.7]|nr:hypothetical protein BGI41_03665 [Methanobrevibacter sp. 87.7]